MSPLAVALLKYGPWLFVAFALAFAVKVPMFPLHTWLPDAHVAGAGGRLDHPGRRDAEDGHLRLLALRHAASSRWRRAQFRPFLAVLAVIGIVYGSLMCLAQRDIKKLIAYSSVAHLGFCMLGMLAFTGGGRDRLGLPDAQPRRLHRRALPPLRHALRAAPHPADRPTTAASPR